MNLVLSMQIKYFTSYYFVSQTEPAWSGKSWRWKFQYYKWWRSIPLHPILCKKLIIQIAVSIIFILLCQRLYFSFSLTPICGLLIYWSLLDQFSWSNIFSRPSPVSDLLSWTLFITVLNYSFPGLPADHWELFSAAKRHLVFVATGSFKQRQATKMLEYLISMKVYQLSNFSHY